MTLELAMTAAATEAERTGRVQAVYRLRGWNADVYGVRAKEQLPGDAEIAATYKPSTPAPPPAPAEGMLF